MVGARSGKDLISSRGTGRTPPTAACKDRNALKERTEIIDGKEYKVTTLPSDPRLRPSAVKRRTLWNSLSSREKKRYLAEVRRKARAKRRRKRKKKGGNG